MKEKDFDFYRAKSLKITEEASSAWELGFEIYMKEVTRLLDEKGLTFNEKKRRFSKDGSTDWTLEHFKSHYADYYPPQEGIDSAGGLLTSKV